MGSYKGALINGSSHTYLVPTYMWSKSGNHRNLNSRAIYSKALPFLVLMKSMAQEFERPILNPCTEKSCSKKFQWLIISSSFALKLFRYDVSRWAFQIFEPYTFIKTKNGESLIFGTSINTFLHPWI